MTLKQLAEDWSSSIGYYLESAEENGPINLAALHDHLVCEHGYPGSLRSLQRYYVNHFPKPRRRARRRVETPPGAQAQADWAEWPQVQIGGRVVYAYQFHLLLSHSRFPAIVDGWGRDGIDRVLAIEVVDGSPFESRDYELWSRWKRNLVRAAIESPYYRQVESITLRGEIELHVFDRVHRTSSER